LFCEATAGAVGIDFFADGIDIFIFGAGVGCVADVVFCTSVLRPLLSPSGAAVAAAEMDEIKAAISSASAGSEARVGGLAAA
jgi:hypothetical protein